MAINSISVISATVDVPVLGLPGNNFALYCVMPINFGPPFTKWICHDTEVDDSIPQKYSHILKGVRYFEILRTN